MARDAPGTQCEEHGEHHRELLGQDRHGERQAAEHAAQPVAAHQRVGERKREAENDREGRHQPHDARRLALEHRLAGLERRERGADAPELAARPGRTRFGARVAFHQQGP